MELELINLELINLMWNWPNGIDPVPAYDLIFKEYTYGYGFDYETTVTVTTSLFG